MIWKIKQMGERNKYKIAYLTGPTTSTDFPTVGSFQGNQPKEDAFVSKFNAAGDTLLYSTSLGGSAEEQGAGIALDGSGKAYVTGYTKSTDFPVLDAIQSAKGADSCSASPCADAFVTAFNASGTTLAFTTYLGGSWEDYSNAIALDSFGGMYITGYTFSSDFPTTAGVYDRTMSGASYSEAFVTKISALAPPATPTPTVTSTPTIKYTVMLLMILRWHPRSWKWVY